VRIGSLFSGAAGLDRAVASFFDGEVSWFSENDPAASAVLSHHFPKVPNLGDIEAISWSDVPSVDILCGGFPCVDVSAAGRRAGMHGTTSGLWSRMADAIDALRPRYVVIENVKGLLNANAHRPVESNQDDLGGESDGLVLRAMGAVLGDVSDIGGYECRWVTVSAAAAGAAHLRERVFILAVRADADNLKSPVPCPVSGQNISLLPTPCASDRFGAGPHGKGSMDLRTTVTTLPLSNSQVQWGNYSEAIQRWERITGNAPPPAVERGDFVDWRLSAEFASWMMGWPPGWVTDPEIGISRKSQIRIVGNGVVCRQAQLALQLLACPAPFPAQRTSC
jgi:DNA (cytosine-5)-methyltransferase 1